VNVVTVVGLLAGLLVVVVGWLIFFFCRPLPRTRGTIRVPGLQGPVEVIRDRWGVPHIYADSAEDLFFAQGYVHAQDRLWQMELQRRAGSGRLSEVLGETTLEIDRFFRVLGLNRAAEAEAEALDDETRRVLEAYVAGVNAYIASRPGRLSVEFSLLRFRPEPWQPVDCLYWAKVMAWNLSSNWASELIRARLAAKLGADRAADLEPTYPTDNPPIVPGANPPEGADLPEDIEAPPNGWRSDALLDALRLAERLFQGDFAAANPASPPPGLAQAGGNSNQWVVAGSRSASRAPLLANDTHLPLQMPIGWYQVHLVGGEYNVMGVSFPGLPGVIVGHNEHCAWGLTTAWQDAQDLYVEKLNPENSHQYEYKGEWLEAKVIREEIRVKGQDEPAVQEVVVTRHGPIVSELVGEETSLALRWVALEPSHLLRSALRYNRARNWEEFRAALGDWSTPAHNFVYADVEGNIAFLQAGWMPVRAKGYGLAPVPGWTGEYEWQDYLSLDELPQAYNPESGWLATANNLVVEAQYPHFLSADLENPIRARRVVDLITSKINLTADDFARFQRDTLSRQAERFTHHLSALEPRGDRERRALAYLANWDHHLSPNSVAASIYHVCRLRALHVFFGGPLGELIDSYVGLGLTPLGDVSPYHGRSFVRLLELLDNHSNGADDGWLRDVRDSSARSVPVLLRQALREALDLLEKELGHDIARWTWGRLNTVHFAHPVGSIKPLNLFFNRGPYPMGGDHDTLLRASGQPCFPFEPILVGDAVRFIADLSDWEECRIVISGGQSGHVASGHYADLIPLWRQGHFVPMPFKRASVERQARRLLTLMPEG
jgi:penicillin amidase